MSVSENKPGQRDVVLGGQRIEPPKNSVVLGGIEGEQLGLSGLSTFTFDVVTLNQRGQRHEPNQPRQAHYFTEDLGNGIGLDMVLIPGGEFWMGSLETEEGHDKSESPRHRVTVPTYLMGRYPITQAQWRQLVQGTPQINRKLEPNPSLFKGEQTPVESVAWDDSVEWCSRLSAKTHRTYRLPSEAEWEYACRAETETPFHFGETISTYVANYDGSFRYAAGANRKCRYKTTPVDFFNASNRFGLCDMHGNVWEWCQDTWHQTYEGAPTDGTAWENKNDNDSIYRVLRGGALNYGPGFCRSANRNWIATNRNWNVAEQQGNNSGFRVVCAVPRLL